jgi:hypothetical protein
LREHHRVRRLIGNPGRGIAVLLAYGTRGNEAIAESRGQCRNHGVDGALIATQVFCILVHGHRPGNVASCKLSEPLTHCTARRVLAEGEAVRGAYD